MYRHRSGGWWYGNPFPRAVTNACAAGGEDPDDFGGELPGAAGMFEHFGAHDGRERSRL